MKSEFPAHVQAEAYGHCSLCPRNCGVNRNTGQRGFCKETAELKIASACLHFGEEPPITGCNGSGTIFISGCNLGCGFCQNYQISREGMGKSIEIDEFVQICRTLEYSGAENINVVTGSHAIPAIAAGLAQAKKNGLRIPVCWNSSAYESLEALDMLADSVDIWLPDLKTVEAQMSKTLFGTGDYGETAKKAIRHMSELSPLRFEPCLPKNACKKLDAQPDTERAEKMLSGLIVRHLVLPGCLNNTVKTLDWLKEHVDGKACISLMTQYTPVQNTSKERIFPGRFINRKEFDYIKQLIYDYDFEYLFYQELENDDSWLPDFNRIQPFSNSLAKPLWHWKNGFTNGL